MWVLGEATRCARQRVKEHDMLIVTGDINAMVRNDNWAYESVMGKHWLGQRNDSGERFCDMCDMNELVISGTLFPHKTIRKVTWVSQGGNAMNQIDHVLINRRFRNSVKDTRVYVQVCRYRKWPPSCMYSSQVETEQENNREEKMQGQVSYSKVD